MFTLKIEQIVEVRFEDEVKVCRIIGVDPDPKATVWVVEQADVDKGHFVPRNDIMELV